MDSTEAGEKLRAFVVGSLGKPDLLDDDNIFEVGEATSLYSMEVLLFIEETLGIPLDDDDLERDNFDSIGAMNRLISRKLAIV